MKVVVLAGGYGSRLLEETVIKPKPMVEIGGRPILWHIMSTYAAYGCKEFVIALGYKGDYIKNYFIARYHMQGSITVNLGNGSVKLHDEQVKHDWLIHLMDTGLDTATGGRLLRLRDQLKDETFMFTYGDGVSDVNIEELLRFHKSHGKLVTVTAVRPPARFGILDFEDEATPIVTRFGEKPQLSEGWINGGYFVVEPAALQYLGGETEAWEGAPLQRLTEDRQLVAYRHGGFWQCMDTLRDVKYLDELWTGNKAPGNVWSD